MERVAIYGGYRVINNRRGGFRVDNRPRFIILQRDAKTYVSLNQWQLSEELERG